ncbi:MAG: hypothetical protein GXZ03_09490 [Proteiniphilum sp.]|nr:hypothetical protein [Proteiniphilum sp.]
MPFGIWSVWNFLVLLPFGIETVFFSELSFIDGNVSAENQILPLQSGFESK